MATKTESPLDRICREAREREAAIIANPERYTRAEVEAARLSAFQRERLQVRDILRYGD